MDLFEYFNGSLSKVGLSTKAGCCALEEGCRAQGKKSDLDFWGQFYGLNPTTGEPPP